MAKGLELKDVWKEYKMDSVTVSAVRGVSASINDGEFVAIMGASGSGKSTLLNLIGMLDNPSKGAVVLDGTDTELLSNNEIARLRGKKIGFVFQTFNLYPTLNITENIALPLRIHEFGEKAIQERVKELVGLVGLEHRTRHMPAQLSGGERQRVAIARALSTKPSIILADEPTGNLDSKTSHEIMQLFYDLHENEKKTIILVTHEQELAAFAERIIEIKDGRILKDEKNKKRRKKQH